MSYCNIEYTTIPYDCIFNQMKMIQLENDAEYGDVFDGYILCEQGNSPILDSNLKNITLLKGSYVQLIPLNIIERMVSDRSDLVINGFAKHEKKTTFYPLIGFEKDGNELGAEIIDDDSKKARVETRYYYVNKTE